MLDGTTEGPTRMRLAPSEFVGSVTCQRGTIGALQSYAVRLLDVSSTATADAGPPIAFTSGTVPCDQAVLFPTTAGRYYGAEIRGFDRAVSDAEAATLPGRWTARCGHGTAIANDAGLDPYRPTPSLRGATVPMRGCTSFLDGVPGSTASQIVIDQPSALGTLRCGQAAGEVASFQATLSGLTQTAACGDPLVFEVTGAERYHTIALIGFGFDGDAAVAAADASVDAGDALDASVVPPADAAVDAGTRPGAPLVGVPRWRTQCVGRSLPGLAAPAYCDPLRPLP